MTTLSSVSGAGALQGTGVLSSQNATFGDNPFLRLLTEQLKNQTPLEPVDNESFMNQMASYSSMQEQKDLNRNMLQLLDYQGLLARLQGLSQGSALLGKEVGYQDGEEELTGTVQSVFVTQDGEVRVRLDGDREIGMRQIISVGLGAAGS
jgi:flagellar basal-body rod modification protein FlgD